MSESGLVPVAVLTDEELDALTDGSDDVVVRPYLDALDPALRHGARVIAGRSLAARRLLLEPLPDGPPGTARVHDLLAPVVELRRGAPVVVVLHRLLAADLGGWTGPDGQNPGTSAGPRPGTLRYLFLLDDVGVVEDVTDQGVHTLSVGAAEECSDWVSDFVVPPGAAAPSSQEPVTPPPPHEVARLLRCLGDPVVLAEVTVLHPWLAQEESTAQLLFLGPGGCYHADAGAMTAGPFHPATPQALVAGVRRQIDAALARVGQEADGGEGRSTMGP